MPATKKNKVSSKNKKPEARIRKVPEKDTSPRSQLKKVRIQAGQKKSRDTTFTVLVQPSRLREKVIGRKTFASFKEAELYAQRLARCTQKNTVLIPGNSPVTHKYNLK